MKKALLLLVLFAIVSNAEPIPSVTVAGRTFAFDFEDPTLTGTNRLIMARDIAALWEDQPLSTVQSGPNGAERLFNGSVWATPYQNGLDIPWQIVTIGTNRCVRVSREVSDAYLQAFSLAFSHTNETASIPAFVASLSASAISNATTAQLSAIIFGEGNIDEERRCEIVSELTETAFDRPSLMCLRVVTGGERNVSAGALLLALPCHDRATGKWDLWPAAWLDGRWQLLPLY